MAKKTDHWLETATHGKFYILNPFFSDIRIEDIATHLSHEPRFGAAVQTPYSVAEHSIHACRLGGSKSAKFALLMHDAHEAYAKDLPSPLKRAINELAGFDLIKKLVEPIDKAIEKEFHFRFKEHEEQIKIWDLALLRAEAVLVQGTSMLPEWNLPKVPLNYEVTPDALRGMRQEFIHNPENPLDERTYPELCRDKFLELFEKYRPR